MDSDVKAQLVLATTDIIVNKGLPALIKFVAGIGAKDEIKPITIEDIEAVKGELDSASYFE
jgi:hypothetical protein